MSADASPAATGRAPASAWSPFRHPAFAILWIATVVSNVGGWISSAASGWLMTSLDPTPFVVSLVQVASTLPMFLGAVPAGALADVVDKRKLLIGANVATVIVIATYAAVVQLDLATPANLLLFTFVNGLMGALMSPPWQSIVPQLVPKPELSPAITANSVGVNVSRAIGPAIGGIIIAQLGLAAPFWIDAVSTIGVIGALIWWRSPHAAARLPAERFGHAIRIAFRHAGSNPHLRATLIRAIAFFFFASAYWALLPLLARERIAGGPDLYGYLLGAIGAGAVGGAFALPWLKARLDPDRLVAGATIGTALAMILLAFARSPLMALLASLLAGVSWIVAIASLNVSAQVALPEWVRGRGLAIFVTSFFGALALGSAVWGQAADLWGLPAAHLAAAAGALAAIPLTWRWKLQTGAGLDLTPSMHWPAPILAQAFDEDRGPVLVTVEFRIDPKNRDAFLAALEPLGKERRRDGAYAWGVFEDVADPGRMVETFLLDSWIEHLRQHERVTNADRVLQDAVNRFQLAGAPKVTHLIAAERDQS
jgi:MFS family permease